MVYRRKYGKTKRVMKRKYRKGKKSLAKKISAIAKRVPRNDLKIFEYSLSTSVTNLPAGAPQTFEMTQLLVEGVTDSTRKGPNVRLTSFNIDGYVLAGDVYNIIRISIVRWKRQGIASPAMVPNTNGIPAYVGFWDYDRWEVLYDESVGLTQNSDGTANYPVPKKISRKVDVSRKLHYETTTGQANQQYIYVIQSDSAIIPNPIMDGTLGICFTDTL